MSTATPRTLSTAEERREDVLRAAVKVFAQRGLYGTPTMDIARAAGISQAYLFRLFPTKTELFIAVLERCHWRIHDTFRDAAALARREGRPVLQAMGESYNGLLEDPELLLTQLQGQAAAGEPAVRDALRHGFALLVGLIARESGASDEEIQAFFARGMLCNVMAAMQLDEVDEPWAKVLTSPEPEACS